MSDNNYLQEIQRDSFDNISELVDQLTPEIVDNLKTMVELGKKPEGEKLSSHELESCMEVVIHWEAKNLPQAQQSGYIAQHCKNKNS
ncbi:MAG: DUF1315 family protein [Endozoicomonadaceae bacterium]|nr:DUF1315 family protein [Endozoicomonadaceae bacterium]